MELEPSLREKPDYDRLVVVLGDVEMGAGGPFDDFPHSEFLARLLLPYLTGETADHPIDFVFNGDTFDLLKTPYLGEYRRHITNEVALGKMAAVAAAHPKFFDAIGKLADFPAGDKRVHFVIGNHDPELLFPKVQNFVRARCGGAERLAFPGFSLALGPVFCEHGSQSDPLFRINPDRPFIDHRGERLLNISWASIALLDIALPFQPLLYFHDRLKPRDVLMELLPEIRELLVGQAWKYWTRDFWRDFLKQKDPLLRLNWTMVKEVVRRFTTNDTDVSFSKTWLAETVDKNPQRLFVTGHLHWTGSEFHREKRVLQLGCFRDEFLIVDAGRALRPILKPYVEIYLKDERIVQIVTVEIQGPALPSEAFPPSITDVVPQLRALIDELGDHARDEAARKKQEAADAKEKNADGK